MANRASAAALAESIATIFPDAVVVAVGRFASEVCAAMRRPTNLGHAARIYLVDAAAWPELPAEARPAFIVVIAGGTAGIESAAALAQAVRLTGRRPDTLRTEQAGLPLLVLAPGAADEVDVAYARERLRAATLFARNVDLAERVRSGVSATESMARALEDAIAHLETDGAATRVALLATERAVQGAVEQPIWRLRRRLRER